MEPILQVKGLCKNYDGFTLDHVSFSLPQGCIMGFIGENGAGKSTTIKAILNLIHMDSGKITVFGKDSVKDELEIKERIGVVFDELNFPDMIRAKDVAGIMKGIYRNWDGPLFRQYLTQFGLPSEKSVKEYSRGMKMKLSIAIALSHHAQLLLLDEATSGLDPIVRDEILDVFLEFIQDESRGILFSSHITGDLEKIADYVTFIHQGKIHFSQRKDDLLATYAVIKCSEEQLSQLDPGVIHGVRRHQFGTEALIEKEFVPAGVIADHVSIEDIMLFTVRGEKH